MLRSQKGIALVIALFMVFTISLISGALMMSSLNATKRITMDREIVVLRNVCEIGVEQVNKNLDDYFRAIDPMVVMNAEYVPAETDYIRGLDPSLNENEINVWGKTYTLTVTHGTPYVKQSGTLLNKVIPITIRADSGVDNYIINYDFTVILEPVSKYFVYSIRDLEINACDTMDISGALHARGGIYVTPGDLGVTIHFKPDTYVDKEGVTQEATTSLETEKKFYRRRKFDFNYEETLLDDNEANTKVLIRNEQMYVYQDSFTPTAGDLYPSGTEWPAKRFKSGWENYDFGTYRDFHWGDKNAGDPYQIVKTGVKSVTALSAKDKRRGGYYHLQAMQYGIAVVDDNLYINGAIVKDTAGMNYVIKTKMEYEKATDPVILKLRDAIYIMTRPGSPQDKKAFENFREDRTVKGYCLDFRLFKAFLDYYLPLHGPLAAPGGDWIIYISPPAAQIGDSMFPAVVVRHAEELWEDTSIITDKPLYVCGSFNKKVDGTKWEDAMLIADVINVCSDYFAQEDDEGVKFIHPEDVVPIVEQNQLPMKYNRSTKRFEELVDTYYNGNLIPSVIVNAILIAGNMDTYFCDPAGSGTIVKTEEEMKSYFPAYYELCKQGYLDGINPATGKFDKRLYHVSYNGGLENFVRLLENWGPTKTILIRGCFIDAYDSEWVAGDFWDRAGPDNQAPQYFVPPKRVWKYDPMEESPFIAKLTNFRLRNWRENYDILLNDRYDPVTWGSAL
ncbi:MAG: hypothetical protein ACM3WV_11850 [Bacillota bacterium]